MDAVCARRHRRRHTISSRPSYTCINPRKSTRCGVFIRRHGANVERRCGRARQARHSALSRAAIRRRAPLRRRRHANDTLVVRLNAWARIARGAKRQHHHADCAGAGLAGHPELGRTGSTADGSWMRRRRRGSRKADGSTQDLRGPAAADAGVRGCGACRRVVRANHRLRPLRWKQTIATSTWLSARGEDEGRVALDLFCRHRPMQIRQIEVSVTCSCWNSSFRAGLSVAWRCQQAGLRDLPPCAGAAGCRRRARADVGNHPSAPPEARNLKKDHRAAGPHGFARLRRSTTRR